LGFRPGTANDDWAPFLPIRPGTANDEPLPSYLVVLALPMTAPSRLIWLSWHCQRRLGAVTQLPPASRDGAILNGQVDERGEGFENTHFVG